MCSWWFQPRLKWRETWKKRSRRRQERRGWPLVKGASPRPEKRADIAKKRPATQRAIRPGSILSPLAYAGMSGLQRRAKSPLFFGGRGVCPYSSSPSRKCRGDGAPSGASLVVVTYRFRHVAPLGAPSQRLFGAGPRFRPARRLQPSATSSRAGPSARGRCPGAARGLGGCVRPPPAGAASCSII